VLREVRGVCSGQYFALEEVARDVDEVDPDQLRVGGPTNRIR
jgi:hypothetical protein